MLYGLFQSESYYLRSLGEDVRKVSESLSTNSFYNFLLNDAAYPVCVCVARFGQNKLYKPALCLSHRNLLI